MKKHNTVKIVMICLAAFLLLSWILPAAYFQTSYVAQDRVQMGLFDIFNYPVTALQYFGHIMLYVLVIGAFYGVLNRISAYRVVLDKLAKKFKAHGTLLIAVIMILFAVITSICGLQLGLLLLFPFVISLLLLMGYDKIVALLTTVGSVTVGLMGTTFAYTNVSIMAQYLSVEITSQMVAKVLILVLGLALLIFNTVLYIKKNAKAKVSKADMEYYVPEEVKAMKSIRIKTWPLVLVLDLLLVIMILSFIPWSEAFGLDIFDTATTAVTGFNLFGFPIFGKLLGTVSAFGAWTLTSLITAIAVATLVLALVYKVKFDDVMQGAIDGAKEALQPAVLVLLIYTGLVIVTYHPFQLVIYNAILGLTKGFNVFTASIVGILASLFNADPLYTFNSVIPYLSSIVSDTSVYPVIWVVFQAIYGLVMVVAPTSVVLMVTLSYLNVSYKEWLKNIWKYVLEMLVVLLVVFTILVLI